MRGGTTGSARIVRGVGFELARNARYPPEVRLAARPRIHAEAQRRASPAPAALERLREPFELAQAAATLGDPPVDRGVRDAEQCGNLVVAEPERLQIEGLAILRALISRRPPSLPRRTGRASGRADRLPPVRRRTPTRACSPLARRPRPPIRRSDLRGLKPPIRTAGDSLHLLRCSSWLVCRSRSRFRFV